MGQLDGTVSAAKIERGRSSFPLGYGTLRIWVLARGSQDWETLPRGAATGGTSVPGKRLLPPPRAHRTHLPPAAHHQETDGVNAGIVQTQDIAF